MGRAMDEERRSAWVMHGVRAAVRSARRGNIVRDLSKETDRDNVHPLVGVAVDSSKAGLGDSARWYHKERAWGTEWG